MTNNNVLFLLQLEWLKMKSYRPFAVLVGLFAVTLPAFMLTLKRMPIPKELGGVESLFIFPNVWGYLGYIGNWLMFFVVGFLAVQSIANETSFKTLRQNIISGLSRTDFFLSKFYALIVLNLAATLYYFLWAMIFGFTHTETVYASRIYENIDLVPRFFLMGMGYSALGLFFGVLFNRSILGLMLYFSYVMFLEKILRYLVLRRILGWNGMRYAPENAIDDLIPVPVPKMFNQMMRESGEEVRLFLTTFEAVAVAIPSICLLFLGAYYLLKKRDL
jgi:ABC-2 type transport system permease protein